GFSAGARTLRANAARARVRCARNRSLTREVFAALAQVVGFLFRGRATEYSVPVGEASKALDHLTMAFGVVEAAGEGRPEGLGRFQHEAAVSGHRLVLHLAHFAVLERHVEEHTFHRVERRIGARLHTRDGEA